MSCPVKIKSINYLKDKGAINDKREVIDHGLFQKLNVQLTDLSLNKYGVGSKGVKMFRTEQKNVIRGDGSRRTLTRAIPNEILFEALQDQIDLQTQEKVEEATIFGIEPPIIEFTGLSNQELVDLDNAIEAKKKQDQLRDKIEEYNNLIRCLWA